MYNNVIYTTYTPLFNGVCQKNLFLELIRRILSFKFDTLFFKTKIGMRFSWPHI
jgi:hypothetical protein